MNGPSEHLTWDELACHNSDKTPYPERWREDRAVLLGEVFELIRQESGSHPLKVLSGYRTTQHNIKIGGSRNSQHVLGRALDLNPPEGWTVDQFHSLIRNLANSGRVIRGLGKYPTFVHVDVRPSMSLVSWIGTGLKDNRIASR